MNKNYRIRKETWGEKSWYYPQVKVLWWWNDIFVNEYFDGGYPTLEDAKKRLCTYIKGLKQEYIYFDFERDCKK